jgi:hypothetical protein
MDILETSPSARKSQLPPSSSPHKSKPTLPRKSARAASVEVPDYEEEPSIPHVPDLKRNPIMDMDDEEEADTTESETNSQAEEVEELEDSADVSSEGKGDAIADEDVSEDSENIEALEGTDDDEDESKPTKYVFEPLHPAKARKTVPAKSKGKAKRVIESSEEGESFDLGEVHASDSEEEAEEEVVFDKPVAKSKKAVKPLSKPKSKGAAAKARVAKKVLAESTDEEMESLIKKIGKASLDTKGKTTRKSTRAKAG